MLLYVPLLLLFLSLVNAELYDEFWKLSEHTKGKECHEDFMGSLTHAYVIGAESAREYWEKFETICAEDKGTRVGRMQTFGRSMGEHFQESKCESDTESPICQCFFSLFEKAEDLVNHYIDIGVCGNPEKEMKKLENMG